MASAKKKRLGQLAVLAPGPGELVSDTHTHDVTDKCARRNGCTIYTTYAQRVDCWVVVMAGERDV